MTAYGRASITHLLGRFVVEIQSVNRKFLEINSVLPQEFVRFDGDVKKWVAEKIARGQIQIKLSAHFDQRLPITVRPNIALAQQIKAAWDHIAEALDLKENQGFHLEMLLNDTGILLYGEDLQDEIQYKEAIQEVVLLALEQVIQMKLREGHALQEDIAQRLGKLSGWMNQVCDKAAGATQKYRQKLIDRLEEVLPGCVENEEKVLREVVVYAEKVDIAEEITRFRSHINQFNEMLDSKEPIGKTLEFLIQELNREANTINSKSSDVQVIHLILEIKSELERIREQIQNVE